MTAARGLFNKTFEARFKLKAGFVNRPYDIDGLGVFGQCLQES
jgi:hypothetical protein